MDFTENSESYPLKTEHQVLTLQGLATYFRRRGKISASIYYIQKSLLHFDNIRFKSPYLKSLSLLMKGVLHGQLKQFDNATKSYCASLRALESETKATLNIATIEKVEFKELIQATLMHNLALELYRKGALSKAIDAIGIAHTLMSRQSRATDIGFNIERSFKQLCSTRPSILEPTLPSRSTSSSARRRRPKSATNHRKTKPVLLERYIEKFPQKRIDSAKINANVEEQQQQVRQNKSNTKCEKLYHMWKIQKIPEKH